MLNIPSEVQKLFEEDSISKNFRVHFVNGEYRDLVNADIVSESVVFTESAMSANMFKFGLCESGVIEFCTYFPENIMHMEIFCAIEIDVSSLDYSLIHYTQTSSDVPYRFYRVPYGYFTVDICDKDAQTGISRIVAYNDKSDNNNPSKYFTYPEQIANSLLWGRYDNEHIDSDIDLLPDKMKISISLRNLVESFVPNEEGNGGNKGIFPDNHRHLNYYGNVFNLTKDMFFNVYNTSNITDQQFHNLCYPIVKTARLRGGKYNLPGVIYTLSTYMYARGFVIYIDAKTARDISPGVTKVALNKSNSLNAEVMGTRAICDLDYLVTRFDGNYYPSDFRLTWRNNISLQDVSDALAQVAQQMDDETQYLDLPLSYEDPDDKTSFVKNVQKNANLLEWMISPCVKFCDAPRTNVEPIGGSRLFPSEFDVAMFTVSAHTERFVGDIHSNNLDSGRNPASPFSGPNDGSRDASYTEMQTIERFINVKPIVEQTVDNDTLYKLYVYHETLDGIYEGRERPGEYSDEDCRHTEFLSDIYHYQKLNNYIEICIPTELVVCIPLRTNPQSLSTPCYQDSDQKYKSFVIPVNEFREPSFMKYCNFTSNVDKQYINTSKVDFNAPRLIGKVNYRDTPIVGERVYIYNSHYDRYCYGVEPNDVEELTINSNIKAIVSSYAELQGKSLLYDRERQLRLKAVTLTPMAEILYPSDDLYPSNSLYPSDTTYVAGRNNWYKLVYNVNEYKVLFQTIRYTHRYFKDYSHDKIANRIASLVISGKYKGNDALNLTYDLTNNWIMRNRSISSEYTIDTEDDENMLYALITVLETLFYEKTSVVIRANPAIESFDSLSVITYASSAVTYVLHHRINGIQALKDDISAT